jgi:hypothetical protein
VSLFSEDLGVQSDVRIKYLVTNELKRVHESYLSKRKDSLLIQNMNLIMMTITTKTMASPTAQNWLIGVVNSDVAAARDRFNSQLPRLKDLLIERAILDVYASFEVLVADLLRVLFYGFPAFLVESDQNPSIGNAYFGDIFRNDSILNARFSIIDRKVKSLMQAENIVEAIKKAERRFGISMALSDEQLQKIRVLSGERNVIVHNDGVINEIFVESMQRHRVAHDWIVGDKIHYDVVGLNAYESLLDAAVSSIIDQVTKGISQVQQYHGNKISLQQ